MVQADRQRASPTDPNPPIQNLTLNLYTDGPKVKNRASRLCQSPLAAGKRINPVPPLELLAVNTETSDRLLQGKSLLKQAPPMRRRFPGVERAPLIPVALLLSWSIHHFFDNFSIISWFFSSQFAISTRFVPPATFAIRSSS